MSGLTIEEQLERQLKKSYKMKNPVRVLYYQTALEKGVKAIIPFETFVTSWAGSEWLKKIHSCLPAHEGTLRGH
jgi:hypothetical protein